MSRSKECRDCWWLSDEYTCVCTNEDSPHCADFVLLNQSCPYWDEDERRARNQGMEDDDGDK